MMKTENGFNGDIHAQSAENEMISKALQTAWKSSVAAGLAFAFIMADAGDAEAKKRKSGPKKNKSEISYVMSVQNKAKALEIMAQQDLDREDIRALQRALGNAGKADGRWGPKTAKSIHTLSKKLSADELARISPAVADQLKTFGFSLNLPENNLKSTEVQSPPAPESDFQFAPDIPWDEQIADTEAKLSALLLSVFGDGADVTLSSEELALIKKYFTDMGAMAATAKKSMSGVPAHEPNVKHDDLSRIYDEYIFYAQKAKGSEKYAFSGLPDAVMEFLKGKSLLYAARPALLGELIKYGQGAELSESRFDFEKFNVEFKGFDAWGRTDVTATLTTVGEKLSPQDPYTREVMEKFTDQEREIIRRLYGRYQTDWLHLSAGKLPPDNRASKEVCRILIDPGHGFILPDGAFDSGALRDGISETTPDLERLYYAIALEQAGCEVHATRFPGYALPITSKNPLSYDQMRVASLKIRPAMAVALGAHVLNTDHYNSSPFGSNAKGEIIFFKGASPKTRFVAEEMARTLGVRSDGSYGKNWHVIKDAPSSMVVLYFERAFITNHEDWDYMHRMSTDFEAAREEGYSRARTILPILAQTPNLNMSFARPTENKGSNGAIVNESNDSPRLDF